MAPLFGYDCPAKAIGARHRCDELPGIVVVGFSIISFDVVEDEYVTIRYVSQGVGVPGIEINRWIWNINNDLIKHDRRNKVDDCGK